MSIRYIKGDVFDNLQANDLLCHVVNDIHKWGAGFTRPLTLRFPEVRECYMQWIPCGMFRVSVLNTNPFLSLGHVQFVPVSVDGGHAVVCNMCAQHGIRSSLNAHPLQYSSLVTCMQAVAELCEIHLSQLVKAFTPQRIIAPKFGAGLAGGDWGKIEKLIEEHWQKYPVVICEL